MNIQWYPGHMTKAKRAMQEYIKIVDLIIELRDARAVYSTSNPDIAKLAANKARMVVLNKADMAEESVNLSWERAIRAMGNECILLDSRQKKPVRELMPLIDKACKEKRERDARRGIKNRPIRAMVTGIPNVGKSTLINTISGRATAKTGNKPGVTKGNQWIRLNKSVELLDTPGILWPKFEDETVGRNIAFIGSVNDIIVDSTELARELIIWLIGNKGEILADRFDAYSSDPKEVLESIAKLRGCIKKGGELDIDKAAQILIQEFRSAKLGRISLEKPKEQEYA